MKQEDRFLVRYWCEKCHNYVESNEFNDVITEQCIGLKDINNKLIFEGDIVKNKFFNQHFVVEWRQDRLSFVFTNEETLYESYDITVNKWEIVGNIHEVKEIEDEQTKS